MSIIKNISEFLRWYKEENDLSMNELAKELGIAVSSLQGYMDGTANPRADTIELIAEKTKTPITEMVFGLSPEWRQAETILRAAVDLSSLSAEKRERGLQLLIQLVNLFSQDT